MTEEWGQVTVYDPSMAAQVAEMFNAFDELWPGGFSGGIPYDEQRVRDWLDDTSAIADLIAVDAEGAPVGYCGLYPHWRDEHAAYVSVLGVVPRVKGKKYGKRMLLKAIETARARGMQRMDLHTWSGNLNAVPLYKKVGLFWVPETSVYMQNYIPALAQTSLGQGWFAAHPDWYACFQRELAQAPDKQDDDGFELYTYLFEVGEDRLVGEIDRYGWGICGLERTLNGETIAVKTRLRAHDILIGLPNELTVTVDNRTGRDQEVALTVEPFKGLQWEEPFPLTLSVPDGSSASLSRTFVVDAGSLSETADVRFDSHKASETIRTRLIVDGQVVDLVTGGKLQPAVAAAVAVSQGRSYQEAPLGGSAEVCLDLVNHAKQALRGQVDVFVEGVAASQQQFELALAPEERSGIVVPVPASADPRDPVRLVHVTPSISVDGGLAAMPTHRLSVVADAPDLVAVVEASDGKSVHLLTDALDVRAELEGGRVQLTRRALPGIRSRFGFQAGPPFGISLDDTLTYSYETKREGQACTLVLRATSRQFPDLQICKRTRVRPGVREVEHWVTITNLRAGSAQTVGGRLGTGGGGGLSLDPFRELSRTFTPCGTDVDGAVVAIECDAVLPLVSDTMVPQAPEQWRETWTAAQTLADGSYVAFFWQPDGVSKVKVGGGMLSSLECEPRALAPGERAELFHIWCGFSYTSLPDVRNRWSQLVGRVAIPRDERYRVPTVPAIDARWAGERLVVRGERARKTIELSFATAFPLPGMLRLNLPDGWQGAFTTPDGSQDRIAIPDPVPGTPARIEVELAVPADAPTVAPVQLHLHTAFELDLDLPLLTADAGEVEVEREPLEGQPAFAVSNGALRYAVLDGLSGSLVRLQDAQGRGYLYDSVPDVGPWFFFENHVGGLQPVVEGLNLDMIFGELDALQAEPVEDGRWKGVEVSWTAVKEEHLRGQAFRLAYLTLPGSDLLRVRLRHHNPTPRRVEWLGGVVANLSLGGSIEGTVVRAPGGRGTWTRNPAPKPFVNPGHLDQPWVNVCRGEQSVALLVPASSFGAAQVLDFPEFALGVLYSVLETGPHGDNEIQFAVALNQSEDQIKHLIAALGEL